MDNIYDYRKATISEAVKRNADATPAELLRSLQKDLLHLAWSQNEGEARALLTAAANILEIIDYKATREQWTDDERWVYTQWR